MLILTTQVFVSPDRNWNELYCTNSSLPLFPRQRFLFLSESSQLKIVFQFLHSYPSWSFQLRVGIALSIVCYVMCKRSIKPLNLWFFTLMSQLKEGGGRYDQFSRKNKRGQIKAGNFKKIMNCIHFDRL